MRKRNLLAAILATLISAVSSLPIALADQVPGIADHPSSTTDPTTDPSTDASTKPKSPVTGRPKSPTTDPPKTDPPKSPTCCVNCLCDPGVH